MSVEVPFVKQESHQTLIAASEPFDCRHCERFPVVALAHDEDMQHCQHPLEVSLALRASNQNRVQLRHGVQRVVVPKTVLQVTQDVVACLWTPTAGLPVKPTYLLNVCYL